MRGRVNPRQPGQGLMGSQTAEAPGMKKHSEKTLRDLIEGGVRGHEAQTKEGISDCHTSSDYLTFMFRAALRHKHKFVGRTLR